MRGNPGKRPLNAAEPKPREATPHCPEWLSDSAKAEWKRIVPELKDLGLVTLVDRAALAAYCQAWAELEWATKTLEDEGRIVEEPVVSKGEVVGEVRRAHPAVKLQRDAFARVKAMLGEFGLTPAARPRLSSPAKADKAAGASSFARQRDA